MTRSIYLDNNMTARPSDKSISAMLPFLTDMWGIPSAPHQRGQQLYPSIEKSLKAIYSLLGAKESDDFVFTSCGAEAVNQAIFSTYHEVTRTTGKNQFVTSAIDEAPAIMSIGRLEQIGCVGKMIKCNRHGMITPEEVADALTPRTAMVSLSWANGLTGVVNPVAEIAALCAERGIRFHLDATHVLGKLYFDLEEVQADLISFNGDHFHAPPGTGGLYIRAGVKCGPLIVGGLEQAGRRSGSVNVPALVALGEAANEALDSRDLVCTEVARLRNKLETGLLAEVSESIVFFQDAERLPHCTAIGFPGIINEALLFFLNRKQLFACMGGGSFQQIGLVLAAAGIEETLAKSALNFSLSRYTTEQEIDHAIEIISHAVKRLRQVSGRGIGE